MTRLAAISDIHGNIWALDAVLGDIYRRGIRDIVNLGDHLYGPLAPGATAERLAGLDIPTVRGNQDRQLIEPLPAEPHPTHLFTLSELDIRALDWIRSQGAVYSTPEILLCHGSPWSDTEYLLEEVTPHGVRLRNPIRLEVPARLILCGHTHVPRVVCAGGQLIVNPGSAGLPAYSDDVPFPHKMETGSPHARYAIVEDGRVELVTVAYDTAAAVAAAKRNGRPDWAHALATGWAI